MESETIFALSSGRPPAALAVVRISGPQAHRAGTALTGTLPTERHATLRELRHPGSGERLDQALVLRFDAPASATGEDVVELHCHGGRAVTAAILKALSSLDGLREAQPGEFTRRAFENGRIDLTEAEGLADLIEAETESQRRAALAVAEGGLRRQVEDWRERLMGLSARAERAIDYADEDDDDTDEALSVECGAFERELDEWLSRPRLEPLKEGVSVVVAGPPNAGKSSLINVLCGADKAIVTDVPGTTRDRIEVPLALAGLPLVLVDTAGLRESDDPIERIGIERAAAAAAGADVLVWLGDAGSAPSHERVIAVRPKADLGERPGDPRLAVSAVTGEGLDELVGAIGREARALLPGEDQIAVNRRQAGHLAEARDALAEAASATDAAIVADRLRAARAAFDRLTGRAGIEEVLDALFARFCLGK